MQEVTTLTLTRQLFQLMKQFPRSKLKQGSVDGLTRSEYELLAMLAMWFESDRKALSATELSGLLQITPAGVTHLLNPLEQAGYIERLPDRNDRRVVLIGLTEKGTQVARSLIAEVQENLLGLVNFLGEEDSKTLIRLMSKAIAFFTSQLAGAKEL